jgi:hypothetical protein
MNNSELKGQNAIRATNSMEKILDPLHSESFFWMICEVFHVVLMPNVISKRPLIIPGVCFLLKARHIQIQQNTEQELQVSSMIPQNLGFRQQIKNRVLAE